jgi:hypothetical protein
MAKKTFNGILALLTLTLLSQPVLADELSDRAKLLIEQGQSREAFQLLEPLESARLGDPVFDLLFGIAAVDVGQNTRGVFALERVLALQPDNARARAEIGRAYLALGEHRKAKNEFETVRQQPVPDGVQNTIDSVLAVIERAEDNTRSRWKGYLEGSLGTDSNINSATSSRSVAVPGLGLGILDPLSLQRGDNFGILGGGVSYRRPLGEGYFLTAGANGWLRNNFSEPDFDTRALDGSAGIQRLRDKDTINVTASASTFVLDNNRLRDTWGLNAQWQRDLDSVRQVSIYSQYANVSYPGQSIRNVDRYVLGAAYAQAVSARVIVFGSAYAGQEVERESDAEWLGHRLWGVRAGAQYRIDRRWMIYGNAFFESRDYGGKEPLFNESRRDSQTDFNVGVDYQIERFWRASVRVSHVVNHSNIDIFKYDRDIATASIRRDF